MEQLKNWDQETDVVVVGYGLAGGVSAITVHDAGSDPTVHDAGETLVEGASVSGVWSKGAKGGGSCTTLANGKCTVSKKGLKTNVGTATFTVNDITLAGYTYDAAANHDPDVDSKGTFITVSP